MEHVIEAEVMQPSPFELDFYIFYAASLFYQGFSPLKFYFFKMFIFIFGAKHFVAVAFR